MISGKTREKTCSAVLRTRDLACCALHYVVHLEGSNNVKMGGGRFALFIKDPYKLRTPPFAILFGLCKVRAYHGHDDQYLLISVEVSFKIAEQPNSTHVHRP